MSNLKLLCTYGFNVWSYPDSVNSKIFVPLFKQRVVDCFIQNLHNEKENSFVLYLYNHVKNTLVYENYLDILLKTLSNLLLD